MSESAQERVARFDSYLAQDPANIALLQQAMDHAWAAGDAARAKTWIERAVAQSPNDSALRNLLALAQLRSGALDEAIQTWQALAADDAKATNEPGLRYNMAYALMLTGRHDEAEPWLDEATIRTVPAAAALRVRLLHGQQRYDEAMAFGRQRLARLETDSPSAAKQLSAHLSVLAIDLEDFDTAEAMASRAPESPESQTSLGHVALARQDLATAERAFAQALSQHAGSARAWLGSGLSALAKRDFELARERLQRATELAPQHLGTWIARAWAHIGAQDIDGARRLLLQAEGIDRTFAEVQGSLAVVAALSGQRDEARHRMQAALRLDSESLSARLAQALLLEASAKPEAARAIVEQALAQPMLGSVTLGGAVRRFVDATRRRPMDPNGDRIPRD